MTRDCHTSAYANALMKRHGADAWFHVSLRADELLAAGDLDGHAMFKAILLRIEELEQMASTGSIQ